MKFIKRALNEILGNDPDITWISLQQCQGTLEKFERYLNSIQEKYIYEGKKL